MQLEKATILVDALIGPVRRMPLIDVAVWVAFLCRLLFWLVGATISASDPLQSNKRLVVRSIDLERS